MQKTLFLVILALVVLVLGVLLLDDSARSFLGHVDPADEVPTGEKGDLGSSESTREGSDRSEVVGLSSVEKAEAGDSDPAKETGGFTGRILWADGSSAANLDLWIGSDGFFDRQTGKRKTTVVTDPGLSGVLGEVQEVEEEEPEDFLGTDAKGRFRLADGERDQGYLWVDTDHGVREAFDLRGLASGVELRLRRTGPITIACQGVAVSDRWKLRILPTWRDPRGRLQVGEHLRRMENEPSRSVYVLLTERRRPQAGPNDVVIQVLAGVGHRIEVQGESFAVAKDESLIRAPGRRLLHLERRDLVLPYRILDADGTLSKQSAWILVHREGDPTSYPTRQRQSQGKISWMGLQPGQKLRVGALLWGGEFLQESITLLPGSAGQQLTFRRGTGLRPWHVETSLDLAFDVQARSALLGCYTESRGWTAGTDFKTWFDREDQAGFAIVVAGRARYRLYVPGGSPPGKLLCLDREGRAWLGKASSTAPEFQMKELIKGPLEAVDTLAIHKTHGGPMSLSLEIQVHFGDLRRWVTLERKPLPPVDGKWPVWEKQAPLAWQARLVLDRGSSQIIHLPLGRR